jgi:hypothetical protein
MAGPFGGNREHRDDVVRIAELTVLTDVIEGHTFQNCRIVGPAVLTFSGTLTVAHCAWAGPGVGGVFWPIPPEREYVVGAVHVVDCTFSSCTFEGIGVAGTEELRDLFFPQG